MKVFSIALALISAATTSTALAATPKLELQYFGARGAAETARILLALANESYTDTRFEITPGTMSAPEFLAAKESGDLDMNLGRAPLLLVGETESQKPIGQSKAIERFLSKQFGLMGDDDIEAAQIDCISEHCRDIKDAQMKAGFSFFNRDKSDEEKAEARNQWFGTDMPLMLEKLQKSVEITSGEEGYAVGSKNSYADVVIFSLLKDCTMEADQDDTLKAAEKCKVLLDIAARIKEDSNVAKWVEERPKSMF